MINIKGIVLIIFLRLVSINAQTLINYWSFNGNYNDSVGSANLFNGTNNALGADRFGNPNSALYLSNGYMQIPPGFYFNSSYSITVWVYFTNTIVNNEMIFTFGNSQSDVIGLSVAIYNNPYFNYISNTNQQLDSYKTNSFWFSLQTWYHIAI